MGIIKKNKLHNPQIVTDAPPAEIVDADLGRLWVDEANKNISIALPNKDDSVMELRTLLDNVDYTDIDNTYYKGIAEETTTVELQVVGDLHYDIGYDIFMDDTYIASATQESDDFYAYYYKEVADTDSIGYVRTISTDAGAKHIRLGIGTDTYDYETTTYNLVNYTKIVLSQVVKNIIDIKFSNKDILEHGYVLLDDGITILIFNDPEGFHLNKTVKVKYLV